MLQTQLKNLFQALLPAACLLLSGCGGEVAMQGYMEQEPIQMASEYGGEIISLNVMRGQEVKAQQLLFKLDPSPEDEKLSQAKSALEEARASFAISAKKALRYQQLVDKKALDTETNDEAQSQVQVDKAQVDALQAAVDNAQWALDQKTVLAPLDGRVLDTYFKPGELVNAGQPVLSLLDPKDLYAVFFVPEPILGTLCMGEVVHIKHDSGSQRTEAHISYISPKAEFTPPVIYSRDNNSTLVFKVEATVAPLNAGHFYFGQPVEVYIPKRSTCHE